MPGLDRRGMAPLYYQIQQHLLEQIRSGVLKPGQAIPSEQEIAAQLRVSRMTARQALKSLCEQGVAFSERGKGTFVSRIKLEKNFRQLLSFSEEMQAHGWRPRAKALSFEAVSVTGAVAEALRLKRGEKVVSLRRLRMAGSLPMGIEHSHISVRLVPGLIDHFDPRTSLYQALAEKYGIQLAVADEVVEAGLASVEEAELLGIAKASPVFFFTRTSYIQSGEPVEYVKSTYRGDRYKIYNRLTQSRTGQLTRGAENNA